MKQLTKAILSVMEEVKGIDKSMTVGSGNMKYQGVPDQSVKKVIGEAMRKNGLVLLPTKVVPKTQVDRWEVENGGYVQQKQSVFTEVETEYLLMHESGEHMTLSGYGHGVDSQDKSAGKATTYALKYTLLYMFLVPTGKIDDSDNEHSEAVEVPQKKQPKKEQFTKERFELAYKHNATVEDIKKKYELTPEVEKEWLAYVIEQGANKQTSK